MTIPLTQVTIKVGMKVRCIFSSYRFGKIGTVKSLSFINHPKIIINWDDGCSTNNNWGQFDSFESVEGICIQDCCSIIHTK